MKRILNALTMKLAGRVKPFLNIPTALLMCLAFAGFGVSLWMADDSIKNLAHVAVSGNNDNSDDDNDDGNDDDNCELLGIAVTMAEIRYNSDRDSYVLYTSVQEQKIKDFRADYETWKGRRDHHFAQFKLFEGSIETLQDKVDKLREKAEKEKDRGEDDPVYLAAVNELEQAEEQLRQAKVALAALIAQYKKAQRLMRKACAAWKKIITPEVIAKLADLYASAVDAHTKLAEAIAAYNDAGCDPPMEPPIDPIPYDSLIPPC